MAEIGVLEGYKHKEDVPDAEYMKLENQLSFPLYVVAKEIVNAYRSHLDPLNLTYTQYIVMMALWQYGDLSVKELGQVLRLDSGTLTPLLKKLEAKAFLKRKRSRQDERVVMILVKHYVMKQFIYHVACLKLQARFLTLKKHVKCVCCLTNG